MKVPLLDLAATHAEIRVDLEKAFLRTLDSSAFTLGDEVQRLEADLAKLSGTRFALGVSSGTDALVLALMAMGIGPGDEVITPDYSFFATGGAVARLGATPVFVDIDADTFNVDPAGIEAAITPRTRAIIPVHLFGQGADIAAIEAIAAKRNIALIEDGAQAIGAVLADGRKATSVGCIGCLSFFPSKNLGALGDAGAIVTSDEALFETMRALRTHGARVKYHHDLVGGNFRIDAMQAAFLNVKLPHLARWTRARQSNARRYREGLSSLADGRLLSLPVQVRADMPDTHIYNQFVIRSQRRDALRTFLSEREIQTEVYYPVPFHQQRCFAHLLPRACPESARAAIESLAIPVHPDLSDAQVAHVIDSITRFVHGEGARHG